MQLYRKCSPCLRQQLEMQHFLGKKRRAYWLIIDGSDDIPEHYIACKTSGGGQ